MMDVLSLVCVAVVSVLVTLAACGVYLVVVERWKRQERQEINKRLYEQVKREPELPWNIEQPLIAQIPVHLGFWIATLLARRYHKTEAVVWRCWRCSNFFESEEQPRPLCLCNGCLEQYQKVVA